MAHEHDHEEETIVELIGEDGEAESFRHLITLAHGEETYVLLTPAAPETPDMEGVVVIMRIAQDKRGQDCYIPEEDEAIQEALFARYMDILDEEDEGEDGEDG